MRVGEEEEVGTFALGGILGLAFFIVFGSFFRCYLFWAVRDKGVWLVCMKSRRTLATAMERATGPTPSRMVVKRPIFMPSTVL